MSFFRKERKSTGANRDKKDTSSEEAMPEAEQELKFHEHPRICLIDVGSEIVESLKSRRFNCTTGTLGQLVEVPNEFRGEEHACLLNFHFPANLHEFDIIIVDIQNETTCPYNESDHTHLHAKGEEQFYFNSSFPATIFDPRPYAAYILQSSLPSLKEKESLFVLFAGPNELIEYELIRVTKRGAETQSKQKRWLYDLLPGVKTKNITGIDTKVVALDNRLMTSLLEKYNKGTAYSIVFEHPTIWNGKIYEEINNFVPLIRSAKDEIVAFAYQRDKNLALVFPIVKNKEEFLSELLQNVLPDIRPTLFPYNSRFIWLNNDLYRLPNEKTLTARKVKIRAEFSDRIKAIETEINENHTKFKFLHDLLTCTGSELVKAVEKYLTWLGFANAVNMDEIHPELLDEDIRIDTQEGLFIIEVKGLAGTSTDSECSQVSKYRYRRMKEFKRQDVYAIYCVNHQRFLPPDERFNPPFNKLQIQDATDDDRGLLTTYELFRLYFNISNGFISKDDAREAIKRKGLIRFPPSGATAIPTPDEYHYDDTVIICKIDGLRLREGAAIIFEKDGRFCSAQVLEIQLDGQSVKAADSGEIGIKLSMSIPKESQLWVLENKHNNSGSG